MYINFVTGSPISDLNPILMAANSRLVLRSRDKQRCIPFDENFYTGYRYKIFWSVSWLVGWLVS